MTDSNTPSGPSGDTGPVPVDYKSTVFLPKTDFPMKAGLPDL